MATFQDKARNNPLMTIVTTVILVGAGFAALGQIGTYTKSYDDSHTTEAELAASHPVQISDIQKIADLSICATLDLKISIIEEQIFHMEEGDQVTSRLVEKKRLLRKMEARYKFLSCASLLGVA